MLPGLLLLGSMAYILLAPPHTEPGVIGSIPSAGPEADPKRTCDRTSAVARETIRYQRDYPARDAPCTPKPRENRHCW